ncbi:MAG: hydrogenase nickel incorporation protein HypB [Chloroflexi bacterium]|nr:hydrogenase nickel incorporation protein HypB [Chloroflexota bacterium]
MTTKIPIVEKILSANDRLAAQNQAQLDNSGTVAMNMMASPGAGKTSVILRTIEVLNGRFPLGVIEGDTALTSIDADKVLAAGMPAVQINTGGQCHLDATMVKDGLDQLPLEQIRLIIVENVGNLVCPAAFAIGTHFNVVIASVPEGDDKPYKYPQIYRGIDALLLNKIDLLPYVDFDMDYFQRGIQMLNPNASFFPVSCKTDEGMAEWVDWLSERVCK